MKKKTNDVFRFVNRTRAFKRKMTLFGQFLMRTDKFDELSGAIEKFSSEYHDFLEEYGSLCDSVGPDFIQESDSQYIAEFERRGDNLILEAEAKLKV